MSETKGIGSKLLGLFVETDDTSEPQAEQEEGSREKTPAELVAELAGQTAVPVARAAPPPLKTEALPTLAPPPTNFETLFIDAGMDASELDKVKKAEELLKSLPESTPTGVKRQIVEASLKAFGIELGLIAQGAQNQKRALDAYVKVNENATAKAIEDAEAQIRKLNEQIVSLRTDIEKRTANLSAVAAAAQTRKAEVQKVLEFFQSAPTATSGAA